jgi:phosphoribosylaminoimidazolecarboxamide formyltransferase/IMP cyclohydrolase
MPRALLSVTDKSGLIEFAKQLDGLGFELIATGGTAKALREAGLTVKDVSEVTGFPEMLEGRVKTLHPKIHGGLLADLRKPEHAADMSRAGIDGIAILCVNLYQFEKTVTREHRFEEAMDSIDIGGPAMIRAAAKNHANVLVVVDPSDYKRVVEELQNGASEGFRLELAAKAFRHTAHYDAIISRYLSERTCAWPFVEELTLAMRRDNQPLRYGENPHQRAARFIDPLSQTRPLMPFGDSDKEISTNNWLDADAAWRLARDLPEGACVIVKHGNPCGAAVGKDLEESYRFAKATDPVSSFGGIVAFHAALTENAVAAMTEKGNFLEVVICAGYEPSLIERFRSGPEWTKNVRFLTGSLRSSAATFDVRALEGAYLVQDSDTADSHEGWQVVTERTPSEAELAAMRFQWTIVRHVKSNAITVGTSIRLLGVGAGQMNRVQSVRLALEQAGPGASGAALASDAFFPFPDSIFAAADAGIGTIIQPGGSKKDKDVIAAANDRGIAMVFTGVRHFRH